MSGDVDYGPVTEFFKALASPVRAAIVHLLTQRPHTVTELSDTLALSQPLVSQHLKVLRDHALVITERQGRHTAYRLADEHVSHVFLDALQHSQEAPR
ncbi:ArsR/SmtB family transcription factor [Nocardioides limicola]|uniref:ArsR/SmtB family transcription factor n=1 Tax=Nocardioides limicola TaxID=2803368 RepID=UPI00193C3A29|nr:metalloregulator ArsR/SmtB family transcription factor [Nocardioides sp. DJM-14]